MEMLDEIKFPLKWKRVRQELVERGQATATPVQHEDGREGVYREVKKAMSDVDRKRFQRELHILNSMVNHRAIVTQFDWNEDPERLWYVSEMDDPFDNWWIKWKKDLEDLPRLWLAPMP